MQSVKYTFSSSKSNIVVGTTISNTTIVSAANFKKIINAAHFFIYAEFNITCTISYTNVGWHDDKISLYITDTTNTSNDGAFVHILYYSSGTSVVTKNDKTSGDNANYITIGYPMLTKESYNTAYHYTVNNKYTNDSVIGLKCINNLTVSNSSASYTISGDVTFYYI